MLRFAFLFLVVAVVAGLFGYGMISNYSWEAGKIVFVVFLVLSVLTFVGASTRRASY
jgi:uncharacterized membrane protein YtjA (UPF0391 family)